MHFLIPFGLSALSMISTASAASSTFQIYGYGEGIGGLPLFSSGGQAYFGDHNLINDTEAAPVIFTTDDGKWLGSPNTTDASNSSAPPSWSNFTFAVPSSSSSSHEVLLVNGTTNSSLVTNKFTFYGTFVFVTGTSGDMESLWYARPSETDGIYTLKWNNTGDSSTDQVPLTLKSTHPSN